MARKSPKDPAFNRVVRDELRGTEMQERVLFIDTENNIREAVYLQEFESGELQRVRDRLEGDGVLKGVVHVAANHAAPGTQTPHVTLVEYLPDKQFYTYRYTPPKMLWEEPDQAALEYLRKLFDNGEQEGEAPEET